MCLVWKRKGLILSLIPKIIVVLFSFSAFFVLFFSLFGSLFYSTVGERGTLSAKSDQYSTFQPSLPVFVAFYLISMDTILCK